MSTWHDYPEAEGERHLRDRIYGEATSSRDGRKALLTALLAVLVFLFLLAFSTRQATAEAPAQRVLESGVAATTDVDALLAEDRPALQQFAEQNTAQSIPVAGVPIEVFVTRDEALNLSPAQLRQVVLQRAAAQVYADGLKAFDRTGKQSISRFSSQGLLEFGVGQLSGDTHDRATLATILLLAALVAAAGGVLAVNAGWQRARSLGLGVLAGSLPGVALFAIAWLLAGVVAGSDVFQADLEAIVRAVIMVPLRNYVVGTALGVVILAAAIVLARLDTTDEAEGEDASQQAEEYWYSSEAEA